MNNPRRSSREQRRLSRTASNQTQIPVVKRKLAPLEVVNEQELERIHQASLAILEEVGIEFRDPIALEHWREAGVRVEGQQVFIPADLLMSLVAKAPEIFEMASRNSARRIPIGGDSTVFVPMQGAPFVRDLEGNRRYSTIGDLDNFNKLTHELRSHHIGGGFTCEPIDIAVPWRHLHITKSNLVYHDLPFFGIGTAIERALDTIEMTRIVHGDEFMQDNAVLVMSVSANSPLVWDETMLESLRVYLDAGQAALMSPFVLGAANTPADMAATVAQLNAEALAGIAYGQLYRPGAKMIYGQFMATISMQSGAPMAGTPELSLMTAVIGQLARRYQLPWRTTASQACAKTFDAQSGYESATSMMAGFNAGANFMFHAGGWDEGGLVNCFSKFVIDSEQNWMFAKYAQGISFDRFDDALKAVRRIGPGGHYLGDEFTLKHFQDAFIMPKMMDFQSYEQWSAEGSKDTAQRGREKARLLLSTYQAPELDQSVIAELDAYIAKRESEISPSLT